MSEPPPGEGDLAGMLAAVGGGGSPNAAGGAGSELGAASDWAPVAPLIGRLARKDPAGLVRLRRHGTRRTALGETPSGVLVARSVADGTAERAVDATMRCGAVMVWLDGGDEPSRSDAAWRWGLPPRAGWRVVDTVPDTVVRDLVRQGALAHVEAAGREFGARGADALLDAAVLTIADGCLQVELTNRALAAVTSMGFLPRGGHVQVAVSGRWNRIAAPFGSVFTERAGAALTVL